MKNNEILKSVAAAICDANKFQLVEAVGAGAFKVTYHVRTPEGVSKALKVFQSNNLTTRVERETDAMTRCDHPNIAKFDLQALFDMNGSQFVYSLEEFISGGSLQERLTAGALAREDAASMAALLVGAIAHIARLDLVHRDLKPANVMLRESDRSPVVVDFGLVRNLDATSLTETWIPRGPGTPQFAPPEQLNNEKELIDWRADQFALGVLITTSMTGRHPYSEEDDQLIQVIERVAGRGTLPEWFPRWAEENRMEPLVKMVQPWPVRRYRLPDDLVTAWSAIG